MSLSRGELIADADLTEFTNKLFNYNRPISLGIIIGSCRKCKEDQKFNVRKIYRNLAKDGGVIKEGPCSVCGDNISIADKSIN